MTILIRLFKWIYDSAIGLFVAKETGEIFVKTAFIAAVVASIALAYAAYAAAVFSISLVIPPEFDIALMIIPDNTAACLTIITTLRVTLFVLSLKLGFASIGVK